MLLTAELRQRDRLLIGQNQVLHFSLCGGNLLQRLGGKYRADAVHHSKVRQLQRLIRLPVGPAEIVAVPALRDLLPSNGLFAVEDLLPEQLRRVHPVFVKVNVQEFSSPSS